MPLPRAQQARDADVLDTSGAIHARLRAGGEPTDKQLALINANHARVTLSASDVYVFPMEISNSLVDSYFTRMAPDTLENYVADFNDGRSLQNSHRTSELPVGRSFAARLEQRGSEGSTQDPLRTAVVVDDYIQRGIRLNDVANDDVIRGIDGGTIRDGSIHFSNASYECGVCGQDMARSRDCEHIPGLEYERGGERMVATATIHGAHAIEHSLVFDGSTPRAMIDKAQGLASRGLLSPGQLARVEQVYSVRMRGVVAAPPPPAPLATDPEPDTDASQLPEDLRHLTSREVYDSLGPEEKLRIHYRLLELGASTPALALRATWDTAYVNGLPDSAFAFIEDGGTKDNGGKTVPRSKRHFPHHDDGGKPDAPHVRNALARIPQSDLPDAAKSKALKHVQAHAKSMGIGENSSGRSTGDGMEPHDFVALIAARMPEEARARIAESMIAQAGDTLDRAFVEAVVTQYTLRAGAAMTADMASKAQEALDHLANAGDAHTAARDALQAIVQMGGMAPDDIPGTPDVDDDNATALNAPSATVPPMPPPDLGRTQDGSDAGATRAASATGTTSNGTAPAQVADDRRVRMLALPMLLEDLLADPENPDDGDGDDAARAQVAQRRQAAHEELRRPEHAGLRAFVGQARDGRRYRDSLVADLHEWGVRARGATGYQRALYDRIVPGLGTSELEDLVSEFERDAFKRFANEKPGEVPDWARSGLARHIGRQTVASDNPFGPSVLAAPLAQPSQDLGMFSTKPTIKLA